MVQKRKVMRQNYSADIRSIRLLITEIKYNPHHDGAGRFTTSDEAHISVARDGTRTLGPKHPSNQHPIVQGKELSTQEIFQSDFAQDFFAGKVQASTFGKDGYALLSGVAKLQGFDGLPHVVDSLQPYIDAGETDGFRGVKGGNGAYQKAFMEGDYHAGHGIFGNGTYLATDVSVGCGDETQSYERANTMDEVHLYTDGTQGIMHMTIKKGANFADYEKLKSDAGLDSKIHEATIAKLLREKASAKPNSPEKRAITQKLNEAKLLNSIAKDLGAYATSRGYDGYHVSEYSMNGLNAYSSTHTVILNRTAVRVAKVLIPA